jgi:hypothetical protein
LQNEKSYNPFAFPPDLELAKKHGRAKRIAIPVLRRPRTGEKFVVDVCDCCGLPTENTPIPLLCSVQDLKFTGPSIPLFLSYVKQVALIISAMIVTSGDLNLLIILSGENNRSIKF